MLKNKLFFLVFVACFQMASAQNYTFKILLNQGQNLIKHSDGSTEKVTSGKELKGDDQLIVSQLAYLGLLHSSGKTVELRDPGAFMVKDISVQNARTSPRLEQYAQFISSRMEGSATMNRTGTRAMSSGLSLLLPKEAKLLSSEVLVKWLPDSNSRAYTVSVYNLVEEELFAEDFRGTSATIDLSLLGEEPVYLIDVRSTTNEKAVSARCSLQPLSEEEAEPVLTELMQFSDELSGESVLTKLIIASYLESKGLVADALLIYDDLMKQNPEMEDLNVMYQRFLITNNLQ